MRMMTGGNMINYKKIIDDVFIETLEDYGFIEVIPTQEKEVVVEPIHCSIKIMMPYLGDLVISVPKKMAEEIASASYGSIDNKIVEDVVAEFLNIFTGKAMEKLYPDLPFRIGIPQLEKKCIDSPEHYVEHLFKDPHQNYISVLSRFEEAK